jgi:hypothetical protein
MCAVHLTNGFVTGAASVKLPVNMWLMLKSVSMYIQNGCMSQIHTALFSQHVMLTGEAGMPSGILLNMLKACGVHSHAVRLHDMIAMLLFLVQWHHLCLATSLQRRHTTKRGVAAA